MTRNNVTILYNDRDFLLVFNRYHRYISSGCKVYMYVFRSRVMGFGR
jgi:hypothetical protein